MKNWIVARSEYVEGITSETGERHYPTLNEVAKRHDCKPAYLRDRASKEGWTDSRDIFRAKLEQARQERRTDILASRGAEFDSKILRMAEAQAAMITRKMGYLNGKKDPAGEPVSPGSADLHRLAIALRTVHLVGRLALGEGGEGPIPAALRNDRFVVEIVRGVGSTYAPEASYAAEMQALNGFGGQVAHKPDGDA